MQQKNAAHHQFLRKHKRKLSPKQKNQQLYSFKTSKLQLKKEEDLAGLTQNQPTNNEAEIVLDLKNQLSFLKEEMAKIVHSKLQSVPNDAHNSKFKLLDYYFPKQNNKPTTQSLHKNQGPGIPNIPTQDQSQEMKKIKSKQRLKFSKIKKSQKFSPLPMTKKIDTPTSLSSDLPHTQSQLKNLELNLSKNSTIPALQQQLQTASQRNKKTLELKLKSLVWEQQENIDINSKTPTATIKHDEEKNHQHKGLDLTPPKEVKPAVYELKINRLKKKIKEQDQETDNVKAELKEKNDQLTRLYMELQQVMGELDSLKKSFQQKQSQLIDVSQKLNELTAINTGLNSQNIHLQQQIKLSQAENQTICNQNKVLQHKLKNCDYEILKLQKTLKNHEDQYREMEETTNRIIDSLKGELKTWRDSSQRQIQEKNKILEERSRLVEEISRRDISSKDQDSHSKSNIKEQFLTIPSALSPRNSPLSAKQKQYLSVIKMHQKSIQNYHKDLSFLETQCKNLHPFKAIVKKQQLLLKDLNQLLLNEQLSKINAKYEKKGGMTNSNYRDPNEFITKRSSTRINQP